MNSAMVTGIIIEINQPAGPERAGRMMVKHGHLKARRANTNVHFVNLNDIRVPNYATKYMRDLQVGMHVEVIGRIQGVITESPTGDSSFHTEIIASIITRTMLREDSLDTVGDDLPLEVEDEPTELEI